MKMQLSEIAKAVGITEVPEEWQTLTITSVQFDSRKLEPGALFVPLNGDRDGHDFIENAVKAAATATFWQSEHANQPSEIPALLVDNPLKALQDLAKYYLERFNPKVVAITGSNGKTTTKDMTAAILGSKYNVVKTKANFNNEIGVPLTILGMTSNTEVLVIELGMDRPGQLDLLSHMVQPDTAVITMIGEAHIEFFHTRSAIADAKMEITHGLKDDGLFIYNGDEPLLIERAKTVSERQSTFGLNDADQVFATDIVVEPTKTTFKVNTDPTIDFSIPLMGEYNVSNALAAISVGLNYHMKESEIATALENFDLTKNRTEWLKGKNGERILSDVYNSNPTAVRAVLASTTRVPTEGKRIAVLGDMLELGVDSDAMHADLADSLSPEQFQEVYLVGPRMKSLEENLKGKYSKKNIHYYNSDQLDELSSQLNAILTENDVVILKASHGIHLENVVDAIKE
ncbi:UDP-N-acetylmuramoyl-tripeptide--D-alanyl-D-alanine ligase [Pediococcus claussenii]|uniref:UDP-N-acetylmuramoyl-tripeptide--D-alanyl-D-alanine ligase n=1 Tax=Pediococcus claussenii (strain ATCC BAA-344 / DSM 14800 / JCM 18046 / KCTC 3811 / LMG 21948 / P06) TaxID=701521 RepID=G8PAB0_PEDCP|nr:UDP-N-acetylmuramoyl-tripeptide--D-alanyl-D-alanine ligase [Pediococcus claussenii]AEV94549.1 UDP-N-acetylmuramoyl-tripeptide--D-alanyl-D-alanine ligase family protein [Pediococcus claussenii ATCC BAA-344]ANZ69764.1 UDP-N-acetylmuramoyl-tripeptide--D-alanyl-D-alanine ligase [Pediococcus claussenii]ANZ71581.1 UDP-N-acetylmuramoyl-tripeptide--D-alanyl-D-alanine ligase [Pediococcus claussenii]KRN19745.1 murF protein [Pediococcus claussenii]